MSVSDEIRKASNDAELRFLYQNKPNPQAAYLRHKFRVEGWSLIILSPIGLAFFGVGMPIMLLIGIKFVSMAKKSEQNEKAYLAKAAAKAEQAKKEQEEKEKIDLEYKKMMIEKMKKESDKKKG